MTMQTFTSQYTEDSELKGLEVAKVQSPWRRFFARSFDLFIYGAIWSLFLTYVMNVNVAVRSSAANFFDTFVAFGLMLLIEPLMLAFLGTTPGKWILGLRVEDLDGRYLSVTEAFSRTWTIIWRGFGLNIPIYGIYRHWKSYQACKEGEALDWEFESTLILSDTKHWRTAVYIVVSATAFAGLIFLLLFGGMPMHRGTITVAQFSENYNKLADYFDIQSSHKLDASGNWVLRETDGNVIFFGGDLGQPKFEFTEENGFMTGMRFSLELKDSDAWVPSYQNERILSMLAFVGTQKKFTPFSSAFNKVVKIMSRDPFVSFSETLYGIDVSCDIAYSGYHSAQNFGSLWPMENVERSYRFEFSMRQKD